MGKQKPDETTKKESIPSKNAPTPHPTPKENVLKFPAKTGCNALNCKLKDTRFNFCEEHFMQFKFGLITKAGQPVSDFEKKFEHYQNWIRTQKVA